MGADPAVPHDFEAARTVARSSQRVAAIRQAILMQSASDNGGSGQR